MPAISASAPGKIILFGEHAVVYGRPAIAAPVSQVQAKAIVVADPRRTPGSVHIQAPNIDLEAELADLPQDDPLAAAVVGVFTALDLTRPPSLKLRVTSNIPVAAGLGSGAAVSVAIIRALSAFLGHPLANEHVSSLAYEVEKLHHGTPSGIDNTVITYALPVYFVRIDAQDNIIETFNVSRPFTIVIADTGISSPTAIAVGDVRRAREADLNRFENLFNEVAAITQATRKAIENGHPDALGPLMDENHDLLREMGVSSPELENLVNNARTAGALGAKLSGGGRGGNMIALTTRVDANHIAHALQSAGATRTIITKVG